MKKVTFIKENKTEKMVFNTQPFSQHGSIIYCPFYNKFVFEESAYVKGYRMSYSSYHRIYHVFILDPCIFKFI